MCSTYNPCQNCLTLRMRPFLRTMVPFAARAGHRRFVYGAASAAPAVAIPSALFARSFAAVSWQGGLLGATSTDDYYATNLDLKQAAEMISTPGVLWRAAEADVKSAAAAGTVESVEQYLGRVEGAAKEFLRSNKLHDRKAIMDNLRKLLNDEGQFVVALGGKSVGKSFIIQKLKEEFQKEDARKTALVDDSRKAQLIGERAGRARDKDSAELSIKNAEQKAEEARAIRRRRIVVYDARHDGADMADGLVTAFSDDPSFFAKYEAAVLRFVAKTGGVLAGTAATTQGHPVLGKAAITAGEAIAEAVPMPTKPVLKVVLQSFVEACEAEGTFPCLIVDEANAALVAENDAQKARTIAALRLLTQYTKQGRRMNVILASSEYAEPYRLSALGFKSDHFSRTVLVPEVPPKEMRELLMGKWGMGSNLATAFMSVWGGHIWAASQGTSLLAAAKETFSAVQNPIAFSNDAIRGARYCVQAEGKLKLTDMDGMQGLLHKVAVRGFASFELDDDARVKLITERNVGGVVTQGTLAPGLHPDTWKSTADETIIVPTNQAMRMLLAKRLHASSA